MPIDNLKRLVTKRPTAGSAQNRVPIHHVLPGPLEGRDVQIAVQSTGPLHAIHPWLRGVQRVKEYALLHGRKRVDILNVVSTAHGSSHSADSPREVISSSSSCWLSLIV